MTEANQLSENLEQLSDLSNKDIEKLWTEEAVRPNVLVCVDLLLADRSRNRTGAARVIRKTQIT